jgi:transposase InsO family protein
LAVSHSNKPGLISVHGKLNGIKKRLYLDSGATLCCINKEEYNSLDISKHELRATNLKIRGLNSRCTPVGEVLIKVSIDQFHHDYMHPFVVLEDMNIPILIGSDFLDSIGSVISFKDRCLTAHKPSKQTTKLTYSGTTESSINILFGECDTGKSEVHELMQDIRTSFHHVGISTFVNYPTIAIDNSHKYANESTEIIMRAASEFLNTPPWEWDGLAPTNQGGSTENADSNPGNPWMLVGKKGKNTAINMEVGNTGSKTPGENLDSDNIRTNEFPTNKPHVVNKVEPAQKADTTTCERGNTPPPRKRRIRRGKYRNGSPGVRVPEAIPEPSPNNPDVGEPRVNEVMTIVGQPKMTSLDSSNQGTPLKKSDVTREEVSHANHQGQPTVQLATCQATSPRVRFRKGETTSQLPPRKSSSEKSTQLLDNNTAGGSKSEKIASKTVQRNTGKKTDPFPKILLLRNSKGKKEKSVNWEKQTTADPFTFKMSSDISKGKEHTGVDVVVNANPDLQTESVKNRKKGKRDKAGTLNPNTSPSCVIDGSTEDTEGIEVSTCTQTSDVSNSKNMEEDTTNVHNPMEQEVNPRTAPVELTSKLDKHLSKQKNLVKDIITRYTMGERCTLLSTLREAYHVAREREVITKAYYSKGQNSKNKSERKKFVRASNLGQVSKEQENSTLECDGAQSYHLETETINAQDSEQTDPTNSFQIPQEAAEQWNKFHAKLEEEPRDNMSDECAFDSEMAWAIFDEPSDTTEIPEDPPYIADNMDVESSQQLIGSGQTPVYLDRTVILKAKTDNQLSIPHSVLTKGATLETAVLYAAPFSVVGLKNPRNLVRGTDGIIDAQSHIIISIHNRSNKDIIIHKDKLVAKLCPLKREGSQIIDIEDEMTSINKSLPDKHEMYHAVQSMTFSSRKSDEETVTIKQAQSKIDKYLKEYPQLADLNFGPIPIIHKYRVMQVCARYPKVWSTSSMDLGRTNLMEHSLELSDTVPSNIRNYRVDPKKKHARDQLIQEQLEMGIIEPSTSPWNSPVVLVKKKDGSLRFCVDYRGVNGKIKQHVFPLPTLNDFLEKLSGNSWFTSLDMCSGFFQVGLDRKSREITAFSSTYGHWQYNVLPQGMINSPAQFQQLMNIALGPMLDRGALVYIDDILLYNNTFESHLDTLEQLLGRLSDANLKLKPSKAHLANQVLNFLGFVISGEGILPNPAKCQVIVDWPTPTSAKETKSFLGLCSYYRRVVRHFATTAKCLHELASLDRKYKKGEWMPQHQTAFNDLKSALISPEVMANPDLNKPFILFSDASNFGIGATLSQINEEGNEVVIEYFSRGLTPTQQRYSTTERELLALKSSAEYFAPYLKSGRPTLVVDHAALLYLANMPLLKDKQWRQFEVIRSFNFEIKFRPGKVHENADVLSRNPQWERQEHKLKYHNITTNLLARVEITDEDLIKWKKSCINALGIKGKVDITAHAKKGCNITYKCCNPDSLYEAISLILSNTTQHKMLIRKKVHQLEKDYLHFFEDNNLSEEISMKTHISQLRKGAHATKTELEAIASLLRTMVAIRGNTTEKHQHRIVDEVVLPQIHIKQQIENPNGLLIQLELDSLGNFIWCNHDLHINTEQVSKIMDIQKKNINTLVKGQIQKAEPLNIKFKKVTRKMGVPATEYLAQRTFDQNDVTGSSLGRTDNLIEMQNVAIEEETNLTHVGTEFSANRARHPSKEENMYVKSPEAIVNTLQPQPESSKDSQTSNLSISEQIKLKNSNKLSARKARKEAAKSKSSQKVHGSPCDPNEQLSDGEINKSNWKAPDLPKTTMIKGSESSTDDPQSKKLLDQTTQCNASITKGKRVRFSSDVLQQTKTDRTHKKAEITPPNLGQSTGDEQSKSLQNHTKQYDDKTTESERNPNLLDEVWHHIQIAYKELNEHRDDMYEGLTQLPLGKSQGDLAIQLSTAELLELQQNDEYCENLSGNLRGKKFASIKLTERIVDATFINHNGILCINLPGKTLKSRPSRTQKTPKIVLPETLIKAAFQSVHERSGHAGFEKAHVMLLEQFFRPGLSKLLKSYIKECITCQNKASAKKSPRAKLLKRKLPNNPMEHINMDILGPMNVTKRGNKYILNIIDTFSRWLVTVPLKTKEAKEIADAIMSHWVLLYGLPKILHSDNAKEFIGKLTSEMSKCLGIKRTLTPLFTPSNNPYSERVNGWIGSALKTTCNVAGDNWDLLLPNITYSYNTTLHSGLGDSPYHVIFGRDPSCPKSIYHGDILKSENANRVSPAEYGKLLAQRMSSGLEQVKKHMTKAQDKTLQYANLKRPGFVAEVGTLVSLRINQKAKNAVSRKLFKPLTGPFRVTKVDGKNITIQPLYSNSKLSEQTVYLERLTEIIFSTRQLLNHWENMLPVSLSHVRLGTDFGKVRCQSKGSKHKSEGKVTEISPESEQQTDLDEDDQPALPAETGKPAGAQERRKRGRPRKEILVTPKRGRGRPRKVNPPQK